MQLQLAAGVGLLLAAGVLPVGAPADEGTAATPSCEAALERGCGPQRREDVFACARCAGQRQQALHAAGCDNDTIAAWCAGVAPPTFHVHPWPGGNTWESPVFSVLVGPPAAAQPSFVWYTAVDNRQPIVPGNNVPDTDRAKDTSYTMFDLAAPTLVTARPKNASLTITTAAVLPSSAGIQAEIAADGRSVGFTIDRPRQVCLILNGNMDTPLCIFADPPEVDPPAGPAPGLIYFGPGVHRPGAINVTENQSVYLAGGAHVYGQVRAAGVTWNGFWDGGSPCDNVRVFGRGVLDGHSIPIDFRAHAMIELPACNNVRIEGITTVDSPQYQIDNYAAGAQMRFVKAIAWAFSSDGWSGGEFSLVEDSFFKVNDDSVKLYSTGSAVQRSVIWQMENGCPFMMSWNEGVNTGFMTAKDNDVIAHEKRFPSAVDGVICAFHGGAGYLNNWLFLDNRLESYQYALISLTVANNPWGNAPKLGSISTILIRNLTSAQPFSSPTPFHVSGNESSNARIDTVVYEGVRIAGQPLAMAAVQKDLGELVSNVSVCERGCGDGILPPGGEGWSRDQVCGRTPQPYIDGVQMPPLANRDPLPYCAAAGRIKADDTGSSSRLAPPADYTPVAPEPPQDYQLPPAPNTVVSDGAALAAALAVDTPTDIVLESGVYTVPNGTVKFQTPHRLWSRSLGGAILRLGLVYTGYLQSTASAASPADHDAPGAQLHGLRFAGPGGPVVPPEPDAREGDGLGLGLSDSPTSCFLHCPCGHQGEWERCNHPVPVNPRYYLSVEDCWFDGEGVAQAAIDAKSNDGMVIRRVVVSNFTRWGIKIDQYFRGTKLSLGRSLIISDLNISQVAMPHCSNDNGRSETALWLGVTARVQRVHVRDCGWMGIYTGVKCVGSELSDLNIDRIGRTVADGCEPGNATGPPRLCETGIYAEHYTYNTSIHHFLIGPNLGRGLNSEWDYGDLGNAAGFNNTFSDGVVRSAHVGVYTGPGTYNQTVRRVRFEGMTWAAVSFVNNTKSSVADCDFTALPPGAFKVTDVQIPKRPPWPSNWVPCRTILKTDDRVPQLRFISQLAQPVIDSRASPGTEDIAYGFEGGRFLEVDGAFWLFTAELARAPVDAFMRCAIWTAQSAAGPWRRVGTIAESNQTFPMTVYWQAAGNQTTASKLEYTAEYECDTADLHASPWAPMPVFDEAEDRWQVMYVGYTCDFSKPWLANTGNIFGAASTVPGRAGIGGPYEVYGIVAGANATPPTPSRDMPADGWGGLNQVGPYRLNNGTYAAFFAATHLWGLASSPRGPWHLGPSVAAIKTPLSSFVENPTPSQLRDPGSSDNRSSFVVVFDTVEHEGAGFGFASSADGTTWRSGVDVALPHGCRTPLGLVQAADGKTATLLFTRRFPDCEIQTAQPAAGCGGANCISPAQCANVYAATFAVDWVEARSDKAGTRMKTDDSQWAYNPFRGLPALPKVHHSDQVIDQGIDRSKPEVVDYARITHALPLSLDRSSSASDPADVQGLTAELQEVVAICALPQVNCSISLMYSPWQHGWGYDGASVRGALEQAELQFFGARLANVTRLLRVENQKLQADVKVGAIVLDSETFQMIDNNISGIHSASTAEKFEVTRKHDLIYNLTQLYFPGVSVPMYGRGQMRRAAGAAKAVAGSSVAPSQGWAPPELYVGDELGDSYGPLLYNVKELALMRENYNRVVANARAHDVSRVVPWIALGAGSPRLISASAGFGEFSWAFDYERIYSWMLGRELNDRYFAQYPDLYAAWDCATEAVLYPLAWDQRGKRVGPTNGDTALVRHFVSYVLGAAGILALPQEPVNAGNTTVTVPSNGDPGFCGELCHAANWLLGGGANWGGSPKAPSPQGNAIHSAVGEHYSCPSHNESWATLTHPVQGIRPGANATDFATVTLRSLRLSYRYASVWCPESKVSPTTLPAPSFALVLSHELIGPAGTEVWRSNALPITGNNGVTTMSAAHQAEITDLSRHPIVKNAGLQPLYLKFVFANVVGKETAASPARGLILQVPLNLTVEWNTPQKPSVALKSDDSRSRLYNGGPSSSRLFAGGGTRALFAAAGVAAAPPPPLPPGDGPPDYSPYPPPCSCANKTLCQPIQSPAYGSRKEVTAVIVTGGDAYFQSWAVEAIDQRYIDWSVATTIIYLGTDDHLVTSNLTCDAHARGVRIVVCTPGFMGGAPGNLRQLANATERRRFIEYWKVYLDSQGIDGILPDIEGFVGGQSSGPDWYSNATLTGFMKEIKRAIGPSRVLMFPIQLNWWDVRDNIGGGQDYSALAAATDALFLMAYDETWLWQPKYTNTSAFTGVEVRPFTHSGMDALRNFLHLATDPSTDFLMPIPPEKLLVGIPWYGYDFPCNRTAEDGACVFQMAAGAKYSLNSHQRGVAYFKEQSMIATQKKVLYNRTAAAAHYDYTDPMTKQRHQCWFEDEVTHRAKGQMLKQEFPQLQGIALFTTNVDYFEPLYRAGRFMQFGVSWERPAHMQWQQEMWAAAASFSDGGQMHVDSVRMKFDDTPLSRQLQAGTSTCSDSSGWDRAIALANGVDSACCSSCTDGQPPSVCPSAACALAVSDLRSDVCGATLEGLWDEDSIETGHSAALSALEADCQRRLTADELIAEAYLRCRAKAAGHRRVQESIYVPVTLQLIRDLSQCRFPNADQDECLSSPCQNGGTCVDVADAAAQEQPFYLTEIGQPCPKERELISTLDECSYAAATLGLPDASASLVIQSHQASRTAGCYANPSLWFNPRGVPGECYGPQTCRTICRTPTSYVCACPAGFVGDECEATPERRFCNTRACCTAVRSFQESVGAAQTSGFMGYRETCCDGELERTVDGIEHARDYCVYSLGSSSYRCGEGSVVSCALWKAHCDASC